MGVGEYSRDKGPGYLEIPSEHVVSDVIGEIYGERIESSDTSLANKVILTTKNKIVLDINQEIMKRLDGEEKVYDAINSIGKA